MKSSAGHVTGNPTFRINDINKVYGYYRMVRLWSILRLKSNRVGNEFGAV
jgi:hypothetical protein